MVDFDPTTSIDQDVFEYMTENNMYAMMTSSNDENIEFAIQRIGRLITPKSPKEALEKMLVNNRQKDAIFTVTVEESVTVLRQNEATSGQVVRCQRNTTRSHKVRYCLS